jgi:uncharacterized integral membrane protein
MAAPLLNRSGPHCRSGLHGWQFAFAHQSVDRAEEDKMLFTVLIVLLILLLIGALPAWPYSAGWGYRPGGVLVTVLIIVLILA